MGHAVRWLAAVAAGAVVFEGLDALAVHGPAVQWLTLASPFAAGAVAGGAAGGRVPSRLLAAATAAWVRLGADRAVGLAHGVRHPLEMELAIAALFGLPWMGMAVAGGAVAALARRWART